MKKLLDRLSRRIANRYSVPLLIVFAVLTLLFATALLLGEAYKDIFLILMIWSLPLFLH